MLLLSQRVALDKYFISPMESGTVAARKYNKTFVPEVRKKIMRATKIVVPDEFMTIFDGTAHMSSLRPEGQTFIDRYPLYVEYARLFSPLMFIENNQFGVLLEERKNGWIATFLIRTLNTDNREVFALVHTRPIFTYSVSAETMSKACHAMVYGKPQALPVVATCDAEKGYDFASNGVAAVCELLLFVNTKNTPIREYSPTRQENAKIPSEVLPKYDYKVLDIYRDIGEIKTLDTVRQFMRASPSGHGDRRAHLVRGHFKRKKNGLFWWNPFMRARDNAKKVGVVVKDYNLKVKD